MIPHELVPLVVALFVNALSSHLFDRWLAIPHSTRSLPPSPSFCSGRRSSGPATLTVGMALLVLRASR